MTYYLMLTCSTCTFIDYVPKTKAREWKCPSCALSGVSPEMMGDFMACSSFLAESLSKEIYDRQNKRIEEMTRNEDCTYEKRPFHNVDFSLVVQALERGHHEGFWTQQHYESLNQLVEEAYKIYNQDQT